MVLGLGSRWVWDGNEKEVPVMVKLVLAIATTMLLAATSALCSTDSPSTMWIGDVVEQCPSQAIFTIYVSTTDLVWSLEFRFAFPADLMRCCDVTSTGLARGFQCAYKPDGDTVFVAMAGVMGFTGEGPVAKLWFSVFDPWPSGVCTTFVLSEYLFDGGDPPSGGPDSLGYCFPFGPSCTEPSTWSAIKSMYR